MNDVEDIVQNAYIKAFRKIDSLKDNNFSPWFYTILEREVIDYTRTSYVKNKPIEFSQVGNEEQDISYEDTIENNNTAFEPKASVDYSELKQGILDCLNQLPEMQRSALYLRYIEKRKISEIAQMYDAKENTVKSWLNYGRKGMKEILESLQKQNKSFYGIAIIPFFIWMFSEEVQRSTVVKAAEIAHQAIALEASKTIIATETSKGVVTAAGKHSVVSAVKVAFTTVQTKAVALTVAGVVAAGAGVGVVKTINDTSTETTQQETVKNNKRDENKLSSVFAKTEDKKDEAKKETTKDHTHTWKPVYKTVHHDAVTETKNVVDQEAYDEPVYSTRIVETESGTIIDSSGNLVYSGSFDDCPKEILDLLNQEGYKGFTGITVSEEQYQSGTTHHDAVTHQEEVVVKEAYDEQVLTGYKCSCGDTKDN